MVAYRGRLDPQALDTEAAQIGQNEAPQIEYLDLLSQPEPSFLFSNQVNWYPKPTVSQYATATLAITVPSGMDCVASGALETASPTTVPGDEAGTPRTRYMFNAAKPLRYFSFVVSRLERVEQVDVTFPERAAGEGDGPETSPGRTLDLSVVANPGHRNRSRALAVRAVEIAQFYESLIGDVPYPNLTVALIESALPGGHSPGFFAVLNQSPLPSGFYARRNDPAAFVRFPDFFLAHEMAHQWWGQAVGWRNYHEQWLSEGFAQYFAALYAEQAFGRGNPDGRDLFREVLRHMRKWAYDETDQGPISLGSRLGHLQEDSRIFRALVYNKGALTLHMLRQLVGDDAFFRGIRRFYRSSRFESVTTADFKAALETEADRSLTRFFDRWIYGSTLPRLSFDYAVEGAEAVIHIGQHGEIFDIPVVVTLNYQDGTSAEVTVPVGELETRFRTRLAGQLRSAEISRAEPPLAEIVRN